MKLDNSTYNKLVDEIRQIVRDTINPVRDLRSVEKNETIPPCMPLGMQPHYKLIYP